MTNLDEAEMTERLDRRGLLADARGPGCYALRLDVPAALSDRWGESFDAEPEGLDTLANADEALYCGASEHVYTRLCDHVAGEKRRASVLRVCPPERVVDVTPAEAPFDREYGYALEWAGDGVAVWCDGVVL